LQTTPKKVERQSKIHTPCAQTRQKPKEIAGEVHDWKNDQNIKNTRFLIEHTSGRNSINAKNEAYASIHAEQAFYFTPLRASIYVY
jgi:hypothetical protein